MPIDLGTQGQPDFTQPIALMMDCHRRIEKFLAVLQRVVDRYADAPLDDEGHEALSTTLNYFASAAPRHTEDEEISLFPRMRQLADPQAQQAMARIDRLEADHREAERAHDQLDALGRAWLKQGRLDPAVFERFGQVTRSLTAAYQQHIPIEDEDVFVLASRLLDPAELLAIGREMKQRRTIDPGRPGSRCAKRRQTSLGAPNT